MTTHRWAVTLGRDDEEYRRWQRTCRACGDRVTAYRQHAVYQLGSDAERQPHNVPISAWTEYADCRAPAVAGVSETVETYAAARHPGRGLRPIEPTSAVSQLIDRVLEARSWTVERLAEELRVDPRQISRWRGGKQPSGYATLRLARLALLSRQPKAIRPLLRSHR